MRPQGESVGPRRRGQLTSDGPRLETLRVAADAIPSHAVPCQPLLPKNLPSGRYDARVNKTKEWIRPVAPCFLPSSRCTFCKPHHGRTEPHPRELGYQVSSQRIFMCQYPLSVSQSSWVFAGKLYRPSLWRPKARLRLPFGSNLSTARH